MGEEAEEDNNMFDDAGVKSNESEEDGIDLMDDMEKDYQGNEQLDKYENEGLDNDNQNELNIHDRLAVDQELDLQERKKATMGQRRAGALMEDEFGDEDDELIHNEIR